MLRKILNGKFVPVTGFGNGDNNASVGDGLPNAGILQIVQQTFNRWARGLDARNWPVGGRLILRAQVKQGNKRLTGF